MDINLIKTFLEVYRTRHFGRAADVLFLTQSAVSARIRLLEETLGAPLFERKRRDMQLTPAGRRFLKYAEQLVQIWNRACQDISGAKDAQQLLSVGALPALWDCLLAGWLERVRAYGPELSLLVEANGSELLLREAFDGDLDVVFLLEPPQTEDLAIREVCRLPLILVSSQPSMDCTRALDQGYVMLDWGMSFNTLHERYFADRPLPKLRLSMVRVALEHIQVQGGAAYLPQPLVSELLEREKLFPVIGAPEIERQVFALYAYANPRLPLIEKLLDWCCE